MIRLLDRCLRYVPLVVCVAVIGSAAWAPAAVLIPDGDFGLQTVGTTVGSPWTGGGGTRTVTAAAQSPFTNVFASNGKGANTPDGSSAYFIGWIPSGSEIPANASGLLYFNADFRNTSAATGDYTLVVTQAQSGALRTSALYITGGALYAEGSGGAGATTPVMSLAQNTWYNVQLTLNMDNNSYSGTVTRYGGTSTAIPTRTFITENGINCIYTDGGGPSGNPNPGAAPGHDIDNFVLSNTPLTAPVFSPFTQAVLALNPIAYWRFEDASSASGSMLQNSSLTGATHDGTYGSGVTLVPGLSTEGMGLGSKAASFSGSASGATAPNTGFPAGNSARTVTAWLRTTDTSGAGTFEWVLEYGTQGVGNAAFHIGMPPTSYGNSGVYGEIGAGQWGVFMTGSTPINDGLWHFVAVTVAPGTAPNADWVVYVDGVPETSPTSLATQTVLNAVGTYIGTWPGGYGFKPWLGEIDELAVFGSTLTPAQVMALYQTALVPEPGSLVLLVLGGLSLLCLRRLLAWENSHDPAS